MALINIYDGDKFLPSLQQYKWVSIYIQRIILQNIENIYFVDGVELNSRERYFSITSIILYTLFYKYTYIYNRM